MKTKCLIATLFASVSLFSQEIGDYQKMKSQYMADAAIKDRQSFVYTTLSDTAIVLPSVGLGYRAKLNSYFSLDTTVSAPVPVFGKGTFVLSEAKMLALFYPARKGFYLGIGAGASPFDYYIRRAAKEETKKEVTNREDEELNKIAKRLLSSNRMALVEFGRFSLGYEWERDHGSKSMFVQLSGLMFPTLSFGIGF